MNQFTKINNKEINTYSTLFKDNARTLQLVTEHKFSRRTKDACVKYYYFQEYIKKKVISITAMDTND